MAQIDSMLVSIEQDTQNANQKGFDIRTIIKG
jgi:hypothetical protein